MPLSNEAQLAVLVERMESFAREVNGRLDGIRIDMSEHKAVTQELEARMREQNGRVKSLEADNTMRSEMWRENLKFQDALTKNFATLISRMDSHDAWHGPSDTLIGQRLTAIEDAQKMEEGRRSMLASEWKLLTGAFGLGAAAVGIAGFVLGLV